MSQFFNAEFVLNYMKEHHLSKTKFCKLCHVSIATLNKFLADNLSLRVNFPFKLAKVMGVDVKNLFCSKK